MKLQRGRFLDADDRRDSPRVIVVDRTFAEQWFPQRDPLGARVRLQIDPKIEWMIVGVTEPVRWRTFDGGEAPSMLIPAAQFDNVAPMRNAQLVWRGRFDATTDVEPLREALRRGMPLLSADAPKPLDASVVEASGQARLANRLLRLLTGIALVLSLHGVGALLLYRYERQRRAVGIRLCLGASRGRVLASAFADSLALAIAGGSVGVALLVLAQQAPEAGQLMPGDGFAGAIAVASLIVSVIALVGGLVPAWRIARLEPREALHGSQ